MALNPLSIFTRTQTPFVPTKSVAIIVGHNKLNQGAVSYTGESEYTFNSIIGKYTERGIRALLGAKGFDVHLVFKDGKSDKEIVEYLKSVGVCVAIELHFNSFKGKARGCEILIHHNSPNFNETFRQADILSDRVSTAFRIFQRHGDGVKVLHKGERGERILGLLANSGIMGFIIEPCFANIRTPESEAIFMGRERYAAEITKWLKLLIESINKGK